MRLLIHGVDGKERVVTHDELYGGSVRRRNTGSSRYASM
jgi:hypothetical protein